MPVPRMRRARFIACLLLAFCCAACGPSAEQLSATSDHEGAATRIRELRGTATVARARLSITLDYAGTRVKGALDAGAFLRSNLLGLGTQSAYVDAEMRRIEQEARTPALPATVTARAKAANSESIDLDSDAGANSAATAAPVAVTPEARPRVTEMVLASGVGRDDCATDSNPVFTPATERIYVVARAHKVPAGSSLASVWRFRSAPAADISFRNTNAIDGECIWFYIDETDAPFTPGDWSVELRLDGEPLAPALPFRISGG